MKKRHTGRTVFLILLIAILLIPVSLYCYLKFCGFRDASQRPALDPDAPYSATPQYMKNGNTRVRLTESDFYWMTANYGYELDEDMLPPGAEIHSYAVKLREGGIDAYFDAKYGILPMPLKISAAAEYANNALDLKITEVWLGRKISIPVDKLALYGVPMEFSLDMEELELKTDIINMEFGADALTVEKRFPTGFLEGISESFFGDSPIATAIWTYEGDGVLADGAIEALTSLGYDPTPEQVAVVSEKLFAGEDLPDITARLLALSAEETARTLYDEKTDEFDAHFILPWTLVEKYREGYTEQIADGQRIYETLLLSLRELYKQGALTVGKSGAFTYTDTGEPLVLSSLVKDTGATIDDAGAHIVLMRSLEWVYPVKMFDMPKLADVPSSVKISKKLAEETYNTGIFIKMPCGAWALLSNLAKDRFVIDLVNDGVYESLVGNTVPEILITDDLLRHAHGRISFPAPAADLLPYEVVNRLGDTTE